MSGRCAVNIQKCVKKSSSFGSFFSLLKVLKDWLNSMLFLCLTLTTILVVKIKSTMLSVSVSTKKTFFEGVVQVLYVTNK